MERLQFSKTLLCETKGKSEQQRKCSDRCYVLKFGLLNIILYLMDVPHKMGKEQEGFCQII